MNTHAQYVRYNQRSRPLPSPSLPSDGMERTALPPAVTAKNIAWVRPTELTAYSAPLIGRGIDLQAELIRRARRTPATATRAVRRSPSAPLTRREPPTAHEEGLQL